MVIKTLNYITFAQFVFDQNIFKPLIWARGLAMSTNIDIKTGPNHTQFYHQNLCPHQTMAAKVIVVPLCLIVIVLHLCQNYLAQIRLIMMSTIMMMDSILQLL